MTDLGVSPNVGQWLTAGFLLTMSVVIPITGFLIRRVPTRALYGIAMGLFSAGTLVAALAPGFAVLLVGPRGAGRRHRDHAAAADDHGDDARAARPPRRGHGQHLDRHLGGARRSGPPCPGSCCRSWAGGRVLVVLPIALVTLVLGLRRMVDVGEPTRGPDRRAVGRAVGRRVRRPRLRSEQRSAGRRGCHAAHLGAVRRRRRRAGRVRRPPAHAAAHRPRPAGSAHVPLAHVHHRRR